MLLLCVLCLQPLLRAMLSQQASARPNAAAFAGCQWFSEDMLLRCLQFLDNILQRESGQKVTSTCGCIIASGCCVLFRSLPFSFHMPSVPSSVLLSHIQFISRSLPADRMHAANRLLQLCRIVSSWLAGIPRCAVCVAGCLPEGSDGLLATV